MTLYGLNLRQKNWLLQQMSKSGGKGKGTPTQHREPQQTFVFKNTSNETAPARAVMRVTNASLIGGRDGLTITKPDTTEGLFVVNGPHAVETNKSGVCYVGPMVVAKYTGVLVANDIVGISGWSFSRTGSILATVTAYGKIDDDLGMFQLGGNETGGAFFLTPSGGIAAASGKFTPTMVDAQRYRFNGLTIVPYNPPKFEKLGNHIESAIGGDKVVQAKRIDGSWFVDVEPCN